MKKPKLDKFITESATISLISNGMRLQKELNLALKDFGLNLNQSLILLAIFFEPEKTIRFNELSEIIPTTKGNISHCTSFLEEKKLITRQLVDNDLRGYSYSLTAKGSKLSLSLIKFFDGIENDCDKKFSQTKIKDFIGMAEELASWNS
nr:MarR family winged helix-turn-helix transcriptional regulator [Bacteriovorax sp. HI3]